MQLSDLSAEVVYTYDEYLKWDTKERCELIRGKVYKLNTPNRLHQKLLLKLAVRIDNFLESSTTGSLYWAPFDVRFPELSTGFDQITTVLQPDISVICDLSKLDDLGCVGAPDIVVEILSPGNNSKELRDKFEIYEESGGKGVLDFVSC